MYRILYPYHESPEVRRTPKNRPWCNIGSCLRTQDCIKRKSDILSWSASRMILTSTAGVAIKLTPQRDVSMRAHGSIDSLSNNKANGTLERVSNRRVMKIPSGSQPSAATAARLKLLDHHCSDDENLPDPEVVTRNDISDTPLRVTALKDSSVTTSVKCFAVLAEKQPTQTMTIPD